MHSKSLKIFIGILTALYVIIPLFLILFFMLFSFLPAIPILAGDSQPPEVIGLFFVAMPFVIFPTMMCLNLLTLSLQVFYVIQVVKDRALTDTPRILFILGLFFLPFIAMPLYYLLYYWKDAPQTALAEA